MNEKLKNIENAIAAYVNNLTALTCNSVIAATKAFMEKHGTDMLYLCKIKDHVAQACNVWDEHLCNMVISDLSIDEQPNYSLGFFENGVSLYLVKDIENIDRIIADIDFERDGDAKICITITWLEDTNHKLIMSWDVKAHDLTVTTKVNMYSIKYKNHTSCTPTRLATITNTMLADFDSAFDKYIDKLDIYAAEFMADDEL
jgi:hypothetical protein